MIEIPKTRFPPFLTKPRFQNKQGKIEIFTENTGILSFLICGKPFSKLYIHL